MFILLNVGPFFYEPLHIVALLVLNVVVQGSGNVTALQAKISMVSIVPLITTPPLFVLVLVNFWRRDTEVFVFAHFRSRCWHHKALNRESKEHEIRPIGCLASLFVKPKFSLLSTLSP